MKKPTRKNKNRPVEVIVEKGQQIPIYHTPDTKGGKVYDSFTIVFIQAGKRMRRRGWKSFACELDQALVRRKGAGLIAWVRPQLDAPRTKERQLPN